MMKFRVNIPELELGIRYLSLPALRNMFDEGQMFLLNDDDGITNLITQARFGIELWRPFSIILIILLTIEIILGNAYRSTRRSN